MPRVGREWSVEQARRYQLACVGLHARQYPDGDAGIREAFRDLGSVQLDPLPVLGRNHDLVMQARVAATHPGDLLSLVHGERLGFEYWDKMLCAIPVERFPLFRALMESGGEPWTARRERRLEADAPGTVAEVAGAIRENGPVSSKELAGLGVAQAERRGWKATRAANVALEALWNRGAIGVAHRHGFRRYFDLMERIIPPAMQQAPPTPTDAFRRELLVERVQGLGLLPAQGSPDAWAFLGAARRDALPASLIRKGRLCEVRVRGVRTSYYAVSDAYERLAAIEVCDLDDRVRFIAPLDQLLWSRESLRKLWGFDYVWEVYKPATQRRYGYYVLPILHGDRFVARFDGRFERQSGILRVLSYHPEPDGLPIDHPAVAEAFSRFLSYLGGERICYP